ncbi:glucose-6-phosphate isomerase [Chaetoceros tenuissimus]|uniref:Glucose-6-phosphate isomerase n=1 Tax=Chaetoceros tenuissimus TaxID=426638 RepID=A0AAD3CNY6_9STRA|nr:glucose-6-phosphate isomerase [Chaetoceros tenuissimus]
MKVHELPQFTALQSAADSFKSDEKLHLRQLCSDSSRCAGLVASHESGDAKIILDYSRQQVTGETMETLFDLADKVGFTAKRDKMRAGAKINSTEGRSVLHHALRMPKGYDYSCNPEGKAILAEVHEVRDKIEEFTNKVRSGEFLGATGKQLKNFVCIGIGGSQLGPEFVNEALKADAKAAKAAEGRNLRFLANVDPVDFELCTRDLDPEETLIVVISKTFTTAETMLNARTAKKWIIDGLAAKGVTDAGTITSKHVIAVSTAIDKCVDFGIDEANIFGFWNWVGGRFSVCSAVGVVPLSLQYSYDVMSSFLDGAHNIDEHFFNAPLRENIPVILGLLGL